MDAENGDWQDQIRTKLIDLFQDDRLQDLLRVFHYLDAEELAYQQEQGFAPVWKTLRSAMGSKRVFDAYAERLVEDTKTAERDPKFRRAMGDIYTNMMSASEEPAEDAAKGMELMINDKRLITAGWMGLSQAWSMIPLTSQAQLFQIIKSCATSRAMVSAVDDVVGVFSKVGGSVVMVALAGIYITYDAFKGIRRWYRGEISGKRCAKNIIDTTASMLAGVGGSVGGAAVGSLLGPFGTLAGGIIGSMLSTVTASILCDYLTQFLFDLPKDEALENAYRFLGVGMRASNVEVNSAFRGLCLEYHPDKGGRVEDFYKLQSCMGLIKVARGELY